MPYRCARRLVLEVRDIVQPILITRPPNLTPKEWHDYHCRELSRLRQERNRRGESYSLNRGKVEVGRVSVVRG